MMSINIGDKYETKYTHPEHPGQPAARGSEVGNDTSLNSPEVRSEGRTTIETEPTEPEENSANHDVSRVVRLVRQTLSAVTTAFSQIDRNGKSSSSRDNVNRGASGKIKATQDKWPAIGIPRPTCNRIIYEGRPDKHENEKRAKASTLGSCTNSEDSTVDW